MNDNNDPGTFTGDPTTNAYRYVVIPGGVELKSTAAHDNWVKQLQAMSYDEVCAKYGIKK